MNSTVSFTVLVHEDPVGGYWAEVPELPGCMSQGETLDELETNIREAIEGVLEIMAEDGADVPQLRKWEIPIVVKGAGAA
jgi:predicted RNase H-like HicB family nuclease